MKSWKLGIGSVGLILVLLIALGPTILRRGFSARTPPSAFESILAREMRRLAVPSADRQRANPFTPTPELLAEARHHFADHCAVCHANDGSGNTTLGQSLFPKAPDMRKPETQNLTDGEIYFVIHNGIRFTGMPAWGLPGPDEDSWKLTLFIRHLSQLTNAELNDMEKYNPKSESERAEEQAEDDFLNGKPNSPQPHQH
ncbi:MAG: c-type cytochrome [Terriglobia bacterium]